MAEKVSAQNVADLAGVSRSAVSRFFTPGASVSRKTAEKVRKAAQTLGYRPNVIARSLITGRSRIIGLVVAYLDNYFYPETLEKLSNALQQRGYHVLVFMASQAAGNIDQVLDEILDYQVDGIIAASVALSSDLAARCRAHDIPIVLFNRSQDIEGVASVTSDNFSGGAEVARFLVAAGHQRIGYIAGWEGASTQRDREAGFRHGLASAGRSLHAREVGDFHLERAREAARAMFAGSDHPDAVFIANDHMAFAVMDVLRFELGLSVPGDVSVVGYDDVPPAAWPAYSLTTVRQCAETMVKRTVEVLLSQIEDDAAADGPNVIPGPLIVRSSARTPEGWIKMKGFDPKFRDFPDYIIGITKAIWEDRGIATLRDYYAPDIVVRSPASVVLGNQQVIGATMATLAEFPDRTLLGEDVIWCGTPEQGMLSSHRLLSTATHLGDGVYGTASGRKVVYRILADCHAIGNRIDDEWLIRDQGAIVRQMGWNPRDYARELIAKEGGPDACVKPLTPDTDVTGPYSGTGNDDEWGERYAEILTRIMAADMAVIPARYDRAVQSEYPGGLSGHSWDPVDRFWMGLRASFPTAEFTIHHRIGRHDPIMPPRAAVRWSLWGKHHGWGAFGAPSGAQVYVLGISHAEFGSLGAAAPTLRREFTLYDETAIWKQIALATG